MSQLIELSPVASQATEEIPRNREELLYTGDSVDNPALAETLQQSPIRQQVQSLGEVSLRNLRTTGGRTEDQPLRHHRLYSIAINDFQHPVEITDPEATDPQYAIMSFPGFTEHVECGIRQGFHAELAKFFPEARIISIGTDGIGQNSGSYGWRTRNEHNLQAMARHRIELGLALAARLPLFVQATSMGAPISHNMNQIVLADPELKQAMDIRGQFYISPALVDPHNVPRDMAASFVPGLVLDFVKEFGLKSSPSEVVETLRRGLNYGLHQRELPALANQLLGLLSGTPEAEIIDVTSEIPTVVVAGEKDSLAQWDMWHRAQAANPSMVELHQIKGRGHVMAMKPGKTCDKLSRTAQAKVCQSLGLRPESAIA